MMREALAKLDRKANERPGNSFTERPCRSSKVRTGYGGYRKI